MDLYNLVVSAKLTKGGGGGDIDVDELSVTENGTYSAPSGHAYSPVTVSVPGTVPSGTKDISANGVYDVTDFASASVSVPTGVFPSGTSSITSNGIYDITNFASVDVNVSGGGGGDHDAEDAFVMRTLSGVYTNSRVTKIGGEAFKNFVSLTSVEFSNVINIEGYAFSFCTSLETAVFPKAANISGNAFQYCKALMSAVFLASSVAWLGNKTAFSNTPIQASSYTGSFGSIYVPASLVDSYKSANNWSAFADRITSYVE